MKWKRITTLVVVVLLLVAGLSVWTMESPVPLTVLSSIQLKDSLIAFAPRQTTSNFSDPAGSFEIAFGFDYPNSSIAVGSSTVFKVYIALISEQLSFFARGVHLNIQDANLLVDGSIDRGVKVVTMLHPTLDTISFEFVNTSIRAGSHNATARILFSTTDVFYVGSFGGTTQVTQANGTFVIA